MFEKKGVGTGEWGSPVQILKSTFFVISLAEWVGGKIEIFEKSAYVPSQKYDFSIFVIMKYINATGRLNPITEWYD